MKVTFLTDVADWRRIRLDQYCLQTDFRSSNRSNFQVSNPILVSSLSYHVISSFISIAWRRDACTKDGNYDI